MKRYHHSREVIEAWARGEISRIEMITEILDLLDASNIEKVILELPPEYRKEILDWARGIAFAPPREQFDVIGGTFVNPPRLEHDEGVAARQKELHATLRNWFGKHPWPEPKT